jgi:hypothetical protein
MTMPDPTHDQTFDPEATRVASAASQARQLAGDDDVREVVLLLSYPEQYEAFGKAVRTLTAHRKTSGTVETIVSVVIEAATRVEEGGSQ